MHNAKFSLYNMSSRVISAKISQTASGDDVAERIYVQLLTCCCCYFETCR